MLTTFPEFLCHQVLEFTLPALCASSRLYLGNWFISVVGILFLLDSTGRDRRNDLQQRPDLNCGCFCFTARVSNHWTWFLTFQIYLQRFDNPVGLYINRLNSNVRFIYQLCRVITWLTGAKLLLSSNIYWCDEGHAGSHEHTNCVSVRVIEFRFQIHNVAALAHSRINLVTLKLVVRFRPALHMSKSPWVGQWTPSCSCCSS